MAALTWLGRRLLGGAMTVGLVVTVVFALIQAAPGSPLTALDDQQLSAEATERMRRDFGLDRPVLIQYGYWLARVVQGDFGISLSQQRPVRTVLAAALPHTLLLAGAALVLMLTLGIGIAMLQAARPWSRRDRLLSLVSVTLFSTPVFWLGAVLLGAFAVGLGWFPAGGARDVTLGSDVAWITVAADRLYHLVLPALTLGLAGAGLIARYQRSALLEVLAMDFMRTARAKGLSARAALWRHALPNALLPTITLLGLIAPALLSGAVLVETVFAWPGMGRVTADAILRRDYPLVAGATLIAATLVVLSTIAADALIRWVDPRTRGAP